MGIFDEIESEIKLEKLVYHDEHDEHNNSEGAADSGDLNLEERIKNNLERIQDLNRRVNNLISGCNIHIRTEQFESYDQFIVRDDFDKLDDDEFDNLLNDEVLTQFAGYKIIILLDGNSRTFRRIYHHNNVLEVYSSKSFSKILTQYFASLSD